MPRLAYMIFPFTVCVPSLQWGCRKYQKSAFTTVPFLYEFRIVINGKVTASAFASVSPAVLTSGAVQFCHRSNGRDVHRTDIHTGERF